MSNVSFRIANANKEYVQTITPLAYTNDINAAFKVSEDITKVDFLWVKNNVVVNIEKILVSSGLQSLVMWIFDDADVDFCTVEFIYDPAQMKIQLKSTLDPTYNATPVLRSLISTVFSTLQSEMADVVVRALSSSNNLSTFVNQVTSAANANNPASAQMSSDEEIQKLCDAINKDTKAEIVKPTETLNDYVCNDILKSELLEIKDFFEHSATYKSNNVKIPKGILFKGPPGTGKTYAARCIAGSVDCYFMVCTASALQGQYIGSGAQNIRTMFKSAKMLADKSKKGVIIFIDEFDSLGDRQHRGGSSSGEEDRTLNQLLSEMSGFTESENIMVLAATNYPERLDEALLRSGRFDRQITISYPDDKERNYLVEFYFKRIKMPIESITTYKEIAELTNGLTPADIQRIANESGILTIRQSKTEITLDNINEAINKVITKNIRCPDKDVEILDLVAAHECGHVIAEVLYNHTTPIKVTNYSYGDAGGFTQTAEVMQGILKQDKFIARIKMLLGGRAAEQVLCGYITNGASSDLDKAKDLMLAYYKNYNFEKYEVEKIKQIALDKINSIYDEVVDDFKKHIDILHKLKDSLVDKRVLYAKDINPIVGQLIKVQLF